jgi:hypothetical protein
MTDPGCICKGNWREIVKECEPLFGKVYKKDGDERSYTLFGVVHADDDYYYGMVATDGTLALLTCVCSIESNGFTIQKNGTKFLTGEERLLRKIFGEEKLVLGDTF